MGAGLYLSCSHNNEKEEEKRKSMELIAGRENEKEEMTGCRYLRSLFSLSFRACDELHALLFFSPSLIYHTTPARSQMRIIVIIKILVDI